MIREYFDLVQFSCINQFGIIFQSGRFLKINIYLFIKMLKVVSVYGWNSSSMIDKSDFIFTESISISTPERNHWNISISMDFKFRHIQIYYYWHWTLDIEHQTPKQKVLILCCLDKQIWNDCQCPKMFITICSMDVFIHADYKWTWPWWMSERYIQCMRLLF